MIARAWSSMDRVQQSRLFKIIASCVIVGAAVVAMIVYAVQAQRQRTEAMGTLNQIAAEIEAQGQDAGPPSGEAGGGQGDPTARAPERPTEALDATARMFRSIVEAQSSPVGVSVGIAIVAGLALVVTWMGLALTYLLLGAACGVGLLLSWAIGGRAGLRFMGPFLIGLFALSGAFTAVVRLLLVLLGGAHPVLSVARNVLIEATRMRVSVVFIILLIFGLACLPMLMSEGQPLRYRMQAFLQYATGGAFLLISVLIVVFSVTTVATEQRDKQIWQTATKPVAAWQYLLGKWLGLGALSLALLSVTASGIFLFAEYLRRQPAVGETTAFKPKDPSLMTEDRLLLETQVLTARRTVTPLPPQFDEEALQRELDAKVRQEVDLMEIVGDTPEQVMERRRMAEQRVESDLRKGLQAMARTIEPGGNRFFTFEGMQAAKESDRPLVLRYKLTSPGSMPDTRYQITLEFPAKQSGRVFEVAMDQYITVALTSEVVDKDGRVELRVFNGDVYQRLANAGTINFPPGDLQLSYSTGSFTGNYFRLMAVLWLKLLFVAMVGVVASTFLSFPVATLTTFVVWWAAESARFLLKALENYEVTDLQGRTIWFNKIIEQFAMVIGNLFRHYSDLRPTSRLVAGEELTWGGLAVGAVVVALATAVLYAVGVAIFRRRELAMYSGH